MVDGTKKNAAKAALRYVSDGMTVGLGSGSTAAFFIDFLGEKARIGDWKLKCVPTSIESKNLALKAGLRIVELGEVEKIDVAIDGADSVDDEKNLIKGYGGALTREKIVDYAAAKFICIVDESKMKPLKERVPLEIVPFARPRVEKILKEEYRAACRMRLDASKRGMFITDNGCWIIDAEFGKIENPRAMEDELKLVPGVLENGLFTKKKPVVVIGKEEGVEVL